jgi:hypothetical protein
MVMLTDNQAAQGARTDGLVLLQGFIKDGAIGAEVSYTELACLLAEGLIVILKGVFPPDQMLDYRRAVMRWRDSTPPYPHGQSPNMTPDVNYHRADTGVIKSAIPHVFRQYGFNTPERLEDYVGRPTQWIAGLMLGLQNKVAGTSFAISLTGMRVKLLHYPAGGGFLTEHQHPLEPQRVGLITSLSRIGVDFHTGGTSFRTPFGRVDTTAQHDSGDIILFRYDLPHAVTPVDEGRELDWRSDAGKWSYVLDLRETHGLSQVK